MGLGIRVGCVVGRRRIERVALTTHIAESTHAVMGGSSQRDEHFLVCSPLFSGPTIGSRTRGVAMTRVRVEMRSREETMHERRDRVAPIRDLDPRDQDILWAKALRARMAARCEEGW